MLRTHWLAAAACSVGVLLLAAATCPDQAAHERHVAAQMKALQSRHLGDGAYLRRLIAKGADLARAGRFEAGVFSSSYSVDLAGFEVARCTGAFGLFWCRPVGLAARGA